MLPPTFTTVVLHLWLDDFAWRIEAQTSRLLLRCTWYGTTEQQQFIKDCAVVHIHMEKNTNTVPEFYWELLKQWFVLWPIVHFGGTLAELHSHVFDICENVIHDIRWRYRTARHLWTDVDYDVLYLDPQERAHELVQSFL
ncbi:hypothetical protein DFP72DRAFT_1059358 [Ephemerocybe angulata]|uniref:Uncharacterized protein n=1 Tax=Ephemerocybe angulata TaxID=980116 RepID=A0A8H6MGX9_9AGAR|nr:hypothetical protein DFP72DRAFT_1059358 [Tulosesus angulatus]